MRQTDTASRDPAGQHAPAPASFSSSDEQVAAPPLFSIIVPCYNEAGAIEQTVESMGRVMQELGPSELIMVNDASSDGTGDILERAVAGHPTMHVVHHRINRGYGASLKTGIRQAKGEWVAITDADGTYPNDRLPELFDRARRDGIDMLVGARTGSDVTYSKLRQVPKYFLRAYCNWLTSERIPDMNSGLRIMRRAVVSRFLPLLPDGFSFTTTVTIAMFTSGQYVEYEPISYAERVGQSKIRPIRDTLNFLQLIVRTGVYFAPLRVFLPVAAVLGLAFLVSLGIDVYMWNITQSTLLLLLFSLNTGMFALLADTLHKRSAG